MLRTTFSLAPQRAQGGALEEATRLLKNRIA